MVESAIKIPDSPNSQTIFFKYLMKHTKILRDIMFDQYGNYVVQAVFQAAKDFTDDQTFF